MRREPEAPKGQPLSSHGTSGSPCASQSLPSQAHMVCLGCWLVASGVRERSAHFLRPARAWVTRKSYPTLSAQGFLQQCPAKGPEDSVQKRGLGVYLSQAAPLTAHIPVGGPVQLPSSALGVLAGPQELRQTPWLLHQDKEAGTLATGPVSTPPLGFPDYRTVQRPPAAPAGFHCVHCTFRKEKHICLHSRAAARDPGDGRSRQVTFGAAKTGHEASIPVNRGATSARFLLPHSLPPPLPPLFRHQGPDPSYHLPHALARSLRSISTPVRSQGCGFPRRHWEGPGA